MFFWNFTSDDTENLCNVKHLYNIIVPEFADKIVNDIIQKSAHNSVNTSKLCTYYEFCVARHYTPNASAKLLSLIHMSPMSLTDKIETVLMCYPELDSYNHRDSLKEFFMKELPVVKSIHIETQSYNGGYEFYGVTHPANALRNNAFTRLLSCLPPVTIENWAVYKYVPSKSIRNKLQNYLAEKQYNLFSNADYRNVIEIYSKPISECGNQVIGSSVKEVIGVAV